jgi:hypothetical protein
VNPADPDRGASLITARCGPVDAVIAADTPMLELAAVVEPGEDEIEQAERHE